MSKVNEDDISEELVQCIPGNAPRDVKALVQCWLHVFTGHGFGTRSVPDLDLVEVSIVPHADEPARRAARVVLETTVTQDMLNGAGKMHSACIAHFVDICTTLPIAAMSFANGGTGSAGVSQNINIVYHAPASLQVSSLSLRFLFFSQFFRSLFFLGDDGVLKEVHDDRGGKLRLTNTSMMVGARVWSARIEIWDVTHHRLVASATQVKTEASSPKL